MPVGFPTELIFLTVFPAFLTVFLAHRNNGVSISDCAMPPHLDSRIILLAKFQLQHAVASVLCSAYLAGRLRAAHYLIFKAQIRAGGLLAQQLEARTEMHACVSPQHLHFI